MPPAPKTDDPAKLREFWDDVYDTGGLDFLTGLRQQARSGMIAAWLKMTGTLDDVLDAGCGECLLRAFLEPYGLGRYTGVDVSQSALDIAREKGQVAPDDILIAARLEDFTPVNHDRFSAIVFNEVLTFPKEPGLELRRYREFLAPDGVFVVSTYAPNRPESGAHRAISAIWAETDGDEYRVIDDVTLHGAITDVTFKMRLVGLAR